MQDKMYHEHHPYDVVIIGSGMAALAVGCLLAHSGKKVCLLEAHDSPGGYAHTFQMGDFHFCAQVHYIWGCAPGQPIYEFLKKIGLEEEITFHSFDPNSYDQISLPDGKRMSIPYGFDRLIDNIEAAYPEQNQGLKQFTSIVEQLKNEFAFLPEGKSGWWEYLS